MANVLLITANPNPEGWSMKLAKEFQEKTKEAHDITVLDLYNSPIEYYTLHDLHADYIRQEGELTPEEEEKQTYRYGLVDEFLAADIIAIATPMWNFSVPAVLKAYIDMIGARGKTFAYTSEGPKGLVEGKKLVIMTARGGDYSGELAQYDFLVPYLKATFGFLGIQEQYAVVLEGTGMEGKEERFKKAKEELATVVKKL